jgi:hypothetical protein
VRFLALSPAAAYALLAAVALAVVLLYLLRPPPPRRVVASLLLWARVRGDRKRPAARWLMLLLLALGAALAIALALTRPEVPTIAASAQRLTLILDNSPSMAARTHDGRSRWEHAVEEARALLKESSAAREVLLIDTAGLLPASGFVDRDSAAAALAQLRVATWGNAHVLLAPQVPGAQVHFFTDGVAEVEAPEGAIVHSLFEAADNVAVTAFEARPLSGDPTHYEALVQVLNASPGDQRVRLLITGGDRFSIAQDLHLRAGEAVNATFDVSDFEGGVLAAAVVCRSDAFALDDIAYAVIPAHRAKRVLLATSGNPPLEDALRSLPGVRLTVVTLDGYARAGERDAVVFDRFAPDEPPAAGALLLLPPARKWLAGHSIALASPRITGWTEAHPAIGGIAWANLRVTRASVEGAAKNGPEALVVAAGSASGALVSAGESRARWLKLGFSLQDSNFALQADFPVFLGNALNWLTEPIPVLMRGLGSIEVPLRGAQVRDGSGKPVVASATAQGVVFEAPRVDVYTLTVPGTQILVVANVPDPRYALINRTRLNRAAARVEGQASTRFWNAEPWMLLLLLAGTLLLVEWAAFTQPRRSTAS